MRCLIRTRLPQLQAVACDLANVAQAAFHDNEGAATVAWLRLAALLLHNPPQIAAALSASARSLLDASSVSSQPLPRQALLSELLYRLAVAFLHGGHALAARALLMAIQPTHLGLAVFWFRLGEACMHAAEEQCCAATSAVALGVVTSCASSVSMTCYPDSEPIWRASSGYNGTASSTPEGSPRLPALEPEWMLLALPCPQISGIERGDYDALLASEAELAQELVADHKCQVDSKTEKGKGRNGPGKRTPATPIVPKQAGAIKAGAVPPEPALLLSESESAFGNALLLLEEEAQSTEVPTAAGCVFRLA
jgi:hypothetical protein